MVKNAHKRGQLDLPFNWIYVLIAGAVILLFFVGIVVKQKESSGQQLGTEVNRLLESILGAAASAESTKVVVQTAGLANEIIYFQCTEGVTEYGIQGKGSPISDIVTPLFAPGKIQTKELFLWSLPYKLPYKITDFLYLTAPTIQYVVIGSDPRGQEFMKESKSSEDAAFAIRVVSVDDLGSFSPTAGMEMIRIVDYTGSAVQAGSPVPSGLQQKGDEEVSAVTFGTGIVTFFVKRGTLWESEGSTALFSLGGELDAVHYAAIFAQHKQMFDCGMQKALLRTGYVSKVYQEKGKALIASPVSQQGVCPVQMSGLSGLLLNHHTLAQACVGLYPDNCIQLVQAAAELRDWNRITWEAGCSPLY
ncbi:hypothetical protein HYT55_03380 [Candidatus Woesearchaeota archaeon]|nr:hypothetical protein [Candidatus Woesearchaeota archaeon]